MNISKTLFKEYSRCERVYPLTEIYKKKLNQKVNLFDEDRDELILEILSRFYDCETGDDLIMVSQEEVEAMLPFYKDVERVALENARIVFGKEFEYFENTNEQKKFSFIDNNGYNYYCYLDGYYEDDEEIIVIEVKSASSSKLKNFGPVIKTLKPLFKKNNNIYSLIDINEWEYDAKKYSNYYQKLFDKENDLGKYIYDLAIERYIIENSLKQNNSKSLNKKIRYYLTILNSDFVLDKDLKYFKDGDSVINYVDLTEITKIYLEEINHIKEKMVKNIIENNLNTKVFKKECVASKKRCEFFGVCFKELQEKDSILNYMESKYFYDENQKVYTLIDLVNRGYKKIDSIPLNWIKNENQLIQRKCFDNNVEYLDYEKLTRGIQEIKYPIYHLDFEAFASPLPRFYKEKPFSQSVFQFSIHIEKKENECDLEKDNVSFVSSDFSDQRLELVKKMIETIDLKNGGTVLVYNKSFEYNRIKEFIDFFPQYRLKLELILKHMIDLEDIIHKGRSFYEKIGFLKRTSKINFYNNLQIGKYSIKKLLPVFTDLSYDELNIKNGVIASNSYAKFRYLEKEEIEEIRKDLIDYCGQDTWSMVVILKGLKEKINRHRSELK